MTRILKQFLFCAGLLILSNTQGSGGDQRSLKFYHTHTGKSLQVTYFSAGQYVPDAMTELRVFLADWRNQKQRDIGQLLRTDSLVISGVKVLTRDLLLEKYSDGRVRFYNDIYGRDQKVLDALNGPVIIDLPKQG